MIDSYKREIDYMRISITDRCNLRCKYCMPDGIDFVPMDRILSYEEILTVVSAAVKLGINKIKITGGEPFVRKGCCSLLRELKNIPGVEEVTLTTNGVLLLNHIDELKDIGIDGINISLDTLLKDRYQMITGKDELSEVIKAIDSSLENNIKTKINVVSLCFDKEELKIYKNGKLPRDTKELVELARNRKLDVRFIEMMPIGHGKDYPAISHDILLNALKNEYPGMQKDNSIHGNGPAIYYSIPDFTGDIGLISSIHGKFCTSCNRLRLTSRGDLKACLCYEDSRQLLPLLRQEQTIKEKEELIISAIKELILNKPKQHCFEEPIDITENKDMVSIGG